MTTTAIPLTCVCSTRLCGTVLELQFQQHTYTRGDTACVKRRVLFACVGRAITVPAAPVLLAMGCRVLGLECIAVCRKAVKP